MSRVIGVGLVMAVCVTTAAVEVGGFVEVGEVFRGNSKAESVDVETEVQESEDGVWRFVFTYRGEMTPPADLYVRVKALDGVTADKKCSKTARARLWAERYPTNTDSSDISVRRYRKDDGSVLVAIQTGGNEKLATKLNAENLVFVKRGVAEWRATVEFRKERAVSLPTDPLEYPEAYSVEIERGGTGSDGFFPLGVLAGGGFNTFVGGNYKVVHAPDGKPGVCGISCWAANSAKHHKSVVRAESQDGKKGGACLFDPATRELIFSTARNCVTNAIAKNDAQIFKWEIDNEYLPGFDYSPTAVKCFREWLPQWYKEDVDKFNHAWRTNGLSFAEAVPPQKEEYLTKPGAWMDWTRFQQETFAEFLAEYYKAFYESDPKKRSVNGKDTQSSLEMPQIARYRRGNHELIGQKVRPYVGGVRGMDHYGHGDRNSYEVSCYYNTIAPNTPEYGRRIGMLYGENNNHNGPGWQFAQTVWRVIPNGYRGGHFFCGGWFGCWGDWASFGFINPDGTLRDRTWYLPRFFGMIHRSERFLSTQAPTPDVPRLAILFAQRDLPFAVDDNISPWGFGINSRLRLYSHLRDAGYYVQIIGYEKLNAEYLKSIDGLFLCGAEHLADEDIVNIRNYVKGGGRLFADVRVGCFDEHHLLRKNDEGLSDVLGLELDGVWVSSDTTVDPGDVWFPCEWGNLVRADGRVNYRLTTAKVTDPKHALYQSNKAAVFTENHYGKGKAYWTNTQLGTIRSESSDGEIPARNFFRQLLTRAGLAPGYTLDPDVTCRFRAENPMTDGKGNYAIVVAGRTYEPVPASTFTVKLPKDAVFHSAWIALAEESDLRQLSFTRTAEGAKFALPELKSSAMIYLFQEHPALLGLKLQSGGTTASDGITPQFRPGDSFRVVVQMVNPGEKEIAAGEVAVHALEGWLVSAPQKTAALAAGSTAEYAFTVMIPAESSKFRPNQIWPVTADLTIGDRRTSVMHAAVGLDVSSEGHDVLLSDNWSGENYPWVIWTGADYRWITAPDTNRQESIKDRLWTYHRSGTPVNALLSGDRSDRRCYLAIENMSEAIAEFDLKSVYSVSRILLRGNGNLGQAPWKLAIASSEDGKEFSDWEEFLPEWNGPYADFRFAVRRARYVRIRFSMSGKKCVMDEVWIFGK